MEIRPGLIVYVQAQEQQWLIYYEQRVPRNLSLGDSLNAITLAHHAPAAT